MKLLWEGFEVLENTLYFAMRKNTLYSEEIGKIESIFEEKMVTHTDPVTVAISS